MIEYKEEFEDWDGGDFENLFPEVKETDHPEKSKFKPTERKSMPWTQLCDTLLCTYKDEGLLGVRRKLTTVRTSKGMSSRPDHPLIHVLYELALAGDKEAWGVLYDLYSHLSHMSAARYMAGSEADEVQDVVNATWVGLMEAPPSKMDNFAGLVIRAAEFRAIDHLRSKNKREVTLVSIEDIRNDQGEPMALDELEQTGMEHPWLTATTTETPETIATAADLSRQIAKWGREVGDAEYAAFMAVEVDGVPIEKVAQEFNNSTKTIYRWIGQVRSHVQDRLAEEGIST